MTTEVISANVSTVAQNDAVFKKQFSDTLQNIGSLKTQFAKARGRKALAGMIVTGFIQSLTIINSVSEDVQALILSQHQISMASEANRFSPWIACCFGEDDAGAEKVADLLGAQCPKWMPDKSMARYFHTMEALSEAGFTETSPVKDMVDWIIKEGGCQTIANKRKDKLKKNTQPAVEEVQKQRRDLYLSEGPSAPLVLDTNLIKLPDDLGAYFTLVVEKGESGTFTVRGVGDTDAIGKLNKLAENAYTELLAAQKAAEAREAMRAEILEELATSKHAGLLKGEVKVTPEMIANAKAKLNAQKAVEQN